MRLRSVFKLTLFCVVSVFFFSGCGRKNLRAIEKTPPESFTSSVKHSDLIIQVRVCTYDEIMDYFSRGEDFYHYYYLIQLRIKNDGYIRYTLQSEGNSFFVPPSEILRPYTHSGYSSGGFFFSVFNAVLFFPIYAISMLKSAVETPPFLTQPDIVIPRSFAVLSLLYLGVVLVPSILGTLWEKSSSSYAFHEADQYIMTQRKQFSCAPFTTQDLVIVTPRAGFLTPIEIALYNHKTYTVEKISLPVKLVW